MKKDVQNLVRGSYLDSAEIVATSTVTGEGICDLKRIIDSLISERPQKEDRGAFRMPIDRSFKIKGFGTVVAGTILSGTCKVGDTLEIAPKGLKVRIRGIERHKKVVDSAAIGERAAINLLWSEKGEILRGDVLIEPGAYQATHFLNCYLSLLPKTIPVKNRMPVKLHIGTKETLARIFLLDNNELLPNEGSYVQIFSEEPVVAEMGDRFVVRSFSPPLTLGGGKVLEVDNKREKVSVPFLQHLTNLNSDDKERVVLEIIQKNGFYPISFPEIMKRVGEKDLREILISLKEVNRIIELLEGKYISFENYEKAKERVQDLVARFHSENPYKRGIRLPELKSRAEKEMAQGLLERVIGELVAEKRIIFEKEVFRRPEFKIPLTGEEMNLIEKILLVVKERAFTPPDLAELRSLFSKEKALVRMVGVLKEKGDLIEIEGYLFHKENVEKAREILVRLLKEKGEVTVSEYRLKLGTTRKFIIPLLNYFDSQGVTKRQGDVRVLKSSGAL